MEVEPEIQEYQHLPEYDKVVDWMTNTQGRGLLLMGDVGRGKSIIIMKVVLVLLRMWRLSTTPVNASQLNIKNPTSNMTYLEYLIGCAFPVLDEVGVEDKVGRYSDKTEGFCKVVAAADTNLRPLFLSTNLTPEELLERYGARTIDRLKRLCRIVRFDGQSLRR